MSSQTAAPSILIQNRDTPQPQRSRPRRRVVFVPSRNNARRNSRSRTRSRSRSRTQQQTPVLLQRVPDPPAQPEFIATVISDLQNALVKALSDPGMITMIALVSIAIISHTADLTQGPFAQYVNGLSEATRTIVRNNAMRIFGLMIFAPALYAVPATQRVYAIMMSLVGVFVLPAANVYVYMIYSIKIYLYAAAEHKITRIVITLFGVIFYIWFQSAVASWPHPYIPSNTADTVTPSTTTSTTEAPLNTRGRQQGRT